MFCINFDHINRPADLQWAGQVAMSGTSLETLRDLKSIFVLKSLNVGNFKCFSNPCLPLFVKLS